MATRPSTTATWATTTNYATSADPSAVGQPTKNDPSSIEAQGWDYATRPDPTHFNHWMNRVGTWIGWVKDNAIGIDGGTYVLDDVIQLEAQGITFSALASCIISATGGLFIVPGATAQLSGTLTTMSGGVLALANGAALTLASGATATLSGTHVLPTGSSTDFESGSITKLQGKTTYGTSNATDAPHTYDGTTSFQVIVLPDAATVDRALLLNTTGATLGRRITFLADAVVTNMFQLVVGSRTYNLKNVSGSVVEASFLYNGSAWVPMGVFEGGNALRNG